MEQPRRLESGVCLILLCSYRPHSYRNTYSGECLKCFWILIGQNVLGDVYFTFKEGVFCVSTL